MAGAMQAQPSTGQSAKPSGSGALGNSPSSGPNAGTEPSIQQFLQMLQSQPGAGAASLGGLQGLMARKAY